MVLLVQLRGGGDMAKHSRSKKARAKRRWYQNVGDPIDLKKVNQANPNDLPRDMTEKAFRTL